MDWLLDFQRSFREPVFAFLSTYWPAIATVLLFAVGWFVGALTNSRGQARDTPFDGDGDGGGGDGGGD